ncbi:hypothetical protein GCM10023188_18050 [Pontibacter saemangeumensis]|uniref:N-acetyltransferase domain-containing protein n=1 Tax=Pontibacter saemangeumensis TaxID=1084525 RepID=A0ABP8LLB2_9BACT
MRKRRVIFRADGNSQIGLGHVVRSLALADLLRGEFECVFAIQAPAKELQQQIRQVCEGVIVLPPCAAAEERYLHELDAYISKEEIVVLDGYHFGTAYQQGVKNKGATLVCIDDIHAYRFVADVVINQAGGVSETAYNHASYTRLCLGPAYALLRPPFLEAANVARDIPDGRMRVLLSLGGADPQNVTLQLAGELSSLSEALQVEVVVGEAYRHQVVLQGWLQHHKNFTLHRNLDARQMCELMRGCAVAVTAASGVAYEYAAIGGLLFIRQTADNQQALYRFLTSSGLARRYEELPEVLSSTSLPAMFREQAAGQRRQLDGQSGERLRRVFRGLSVAAGLRLRKATLDDRILLFEWANDPQVRQNSFNPDPITLERHTQWFHELMADGKTLLYIAEVDGNPAAQIRFSTSGGKASISYMISAAFRGLGLGHLVLLRGVEKLKESLAGIEQVEGLVQQENYASVRSFEKAGFRRGAPDPGHPGALRFVLPLA